MEEIWRDIKQYEGLYQVSNLGRVKRLAKNSIRKDGRPLGLREKILKNKPSNNGYIHTCLTDKGESVFYLVHRLVAEAFIPNPKNKYSVNHKNTDKHDNAVTNLEWHTREEQMIHAVEKGKSGIKGEKNIRSKLTQEQANQIRISYKKGNITQKELSEYYNVSRQLIGYIINHKRYI